MRNTLISLLIRVKNVIIYSRPPSWYKSDSKPGAFNLSWILDGTMLAAYRYESC